MTARGDRYKIAAVQRSDQSVMASMKSIVSFSPGDCLISRD
jgi:hypothetical protein